LVTKGMRRALNTRDRGCVVCGAPPVQCDAHHLRSWIDGGTTAVSNLVLLCRIHHVDLHAGKWVITITNGKVHVTLPTWANPPSIKRRTPPRTPAEPSLATTRAHATYTSNTTQPSTTQPGTTKPGTTRPGMTESGATETGATESGMTEPGVDESGMDELGRSGPGRSGPGLSELRIDELVARGLQAGEPGVDGLVRCGPDAGGDEGSVLTATDIRAATMRAVWGEDLPPEPPRHTRVSPPPDFDPWGDADTDPAPSPPCAPR
ncbi:HNH endonuclease signature motif containing protein, partial [Kribbella albertanoniae]|uniref:HNH endonuclease signature motif containing protein n=1 Tax=Kribbella albertanoniae TaxID=1266829 RepID=UPI00192DD04A